MYIKHNIIKAQLLIDTAKKREDLFSSILESPFFLCCTNDGDVLINNTYMEHLYYKETLCQENIIKNPLETELKDIVKVNDIDTYLYSNNMDLQLYNIYKNSFKQIDTNGIIIIPGNHNNLFIRNLTNEDDLQHFAIESLLMYEESAYSYLMENIKDYEKNIMLIPMRIIHKNKNLKVYVRLCLFNNEGATVNIFIEEVMETLNLTEQNPREIKFSEVTYYDINKSKKSPLDYVKEKKLENQTLDDIMNTYLVYLLDYFNQFNIEYKPLFNNISWGIADYTMKKTEHIDEFIEKKLGVISQHLFNANIFNAKKIIESKNQMLIKHSVFKHEAVQFFCSENISIFIFSHIKNLSSLDKNEPEFLELASMQFQKAHYETLKIHEIAERRVFQLRELLLRMKFFEKDIVKDYRSYLSQVTRLNLDYNSNVLFKSDGTPKKTYKNIEKELDIEELQNSVEVLLKNIKDESQNIKDIKLTQLETQKSIILAIIALASMYTISKLISLILLIIIVVISIIQIQNNK